jgi:hypothetical protein
LQAQTLHWVCPVSAGEFLSALTGEFDVVEPGSAAAPDDALDDVLDVGLDVDDPMLELPSPGDCPGGMNGDCGVLVM